ncbi:MAG TPA: hypothetical protein VMD58_11855 [Acidobacteriaceae bacterium]|nr:hypothetical protein [Acidobacteriaceae bacterium]
MEPEFTLHLSALLFKKLTLSGRCCFDLLTDCGILCLQGGNALLSLILGPLKLSGLAGYLSLLQWGFCHQKRFRLSGLKCILRYLRCGRYCSGPVDKVAWFSYLLNRRFDIVVVTDCGIQMGDY